MENIEDIMRKVLNNVNCMWLDCGGDGEDTLPWPMTFETDGFQHLLKFHDLVVYDSENDEDMDEEEMMNYVHTKIKVFAQRCNDLVNY